MATVNDDAAGVYMCTPYNSYGTMGPSGPTTVILQVSANSKLLTKDVVIPNLTRLHFIYC